MSHSPSIAMPGHNDGNAVEADNILPVNGAKEPGLYHDQNSKEYFLLCIWSAASVQHRPDKLTGVIIVCSRPPYN